MAKQRLVAWNETGAFMPREHKTAVSMSLDHESLVKEHSELARALAGGRIVSHHVFQHGYGTMFTFVVEDE